MKIKAERLQGCCL